MSDEWRCQYCGSGLILDSEVMEWVCPICGTVYDYEMLPPLGQSSPLYYFASKRRLDQEVVELAEEIFGGEIPPELKRKKGGKYERLLRALEALVKKKEYDFDWRTIREALEIARASGLRVNVSEIRAEQVRRSIRSLVEACCPGVSADDVYAFAAKHRDLWSGRRPETIAAVFTQLYLKLRMNADQQIPMKANTRRLVKIFEKVLIERGEAK